MQSGTNEIGIHTIAVNKGCRVMSSVLFVRP